MRVGLFASLIDKIQHAYGWTDDVILDLTLSRAVQMQEAINQREEIRHWEALKVTEWQVQSLAAMIANTVEDKKARESLFDTATSLSLTGDGKKKKTRKAQMPRTYRTVDGKEISAAEISNYTYDEIDHTEEDRIREENARRNNSGKNLSDMLSGFTR